VKEVLVTIASFAEEGMTCVIVTSRNGFAASGRRNLFTDRGVVVRAWAAGAVLHEMPRTNARGSFLSQIL